MCFTRNIHFTVIRKYFKMPAKKKKTVENKRNNLVTQ